jgi:phosphohistidine swiveling domain-containing protein
VLARGVAAGGGVASGHVCFSAADAQALAQGGVAPILVVDDASPDDAEGVRAAAGVVTVRAGITSEAAVMARALGRPCVASGPALKLVTLAEGALAAETASGARLLAGDRIVIDGGSGAIGRGPGSATEGPDSTTAELLAWADAARGVRIMATVTDPADVDAARTLGAEGVAILAPDALFAGLALDTWHAEIEDLLARILAAASWGKEVLVRGPSYPRPLEVRLARLGPRVEVGRSFARAVARASARAGVRVAWIGEPPEMPSPVEVSLMRLWREGDAAPLGPAVYWLVGALDAIAVVARRAPDSVVVCAPDRVPLARVALARLS